MTSRKLACLAPVVLIAGFAQNESAITRDGHYWSQTSTGHVASEGAKRLRINTRGTVAILGQRRPTVSYSLTKRVKARSEVDARRLLGRFRAQSKSAGGWAELTITSPELRAAPELTVYAPRQLEEVILRTAGGNVRALDLDGRFEATSDGGRIEADRIGGEFVARTGGGQIRLGSIGGPISCFSAGGGIKVERAGGKSWLETAGGEIVVEEAEGPLHATTMGGNIWVGRAAGSVVAHTADGVIRIGEAGGAVVATTVNGSIQASSAHGVESDSEAGGIVLRGVSGALRASTESGSILAELLATGKLADSVLRTAFGDVTVFIPSNLSVRVVASNTPAGTSGRIISEFPEIRMKQLKSPDYEPARAEGALNGGGPLLKISAVGGTIYLRRRD